MSKSTSPLPDWEQVLSSAARLQRILPDAVLVGGRTTARVHRPVQIIGSFHGIETGIRQLAHALQSFDHVCEQANS